MMARGAFVVGLRALLPVLVLVLSAHWTGMAQVRGAQGSAVDRAAWMAMSGPERVAALESRFAANPNAGKLVDRAEILSKYNAASDSVTVIVTLAAPEMPADANAPDAAAALATLQAAVASRREQVLAKLDLSRSTVHTQYRNFPCFFASVDSNSLEQLLSDPAVAAIEPNRQDERHLAQGIPVLNGSTVRSSYTGSGVTIAILDTGIDYTHPQLGNGSFPNAKVIGGYDFAGAVTTDWLNDPDPFPNGSAGAHGTCCAGIAAGDVTAYGDYIGGVAPGAKLVALKVFGDDGGGSYTSDQIEAVDWCVSNKNLDPNSPIMVISMSLGGGSYATHAAADAASPSRVTAMNSAIAAGITILASSGNDGFCGSIGIPAALTPVISVGAVYDANVGNVGFCVSTTTCFVGASTNAACTGKLAAFEGSTWAGKVTCYSNSASILDVFAPSNNAYTPDIKGTAGYNTAASPAGDYYTTFGGTSAACPYAAGSVAVLQSAALGATRSFLSPADVRILLATTGSPVTDTKNGGLSLTKPLIQLDAAYAAINSCLLSGVTSAHADGSFKEGEVISINVNYSSAVTVTGAPTLELGTGAVHRTAAYSGGSGGTTLSFQYTVMPGDSSSDLDYASSTALQRNGGAITNTAHGISAPLTLPAPGAAGSLGANKAIVIDTTPPVITLGGEAVVTRECPAVYDTDAGATAADSHDGNISANIVTTGLAPSATPLGVGTYHVYYNVKDAANNSAAQVTRTVTVEDKTLPVISRNGSATVTVECGATYTDAGATASDACAGSRTANIVTVNPVNTSVPGDYTVTYNVSDGNGNNAVEVTRTVTVEDKTLPVISRNGAATVTVECSAAYTDAGATASDTCAGSRTANIVTVNPVNTSVPGDYTVTYNVSDGNGNNAVEVTRTVTVEDKTLPVISRIGSATVAVECGATYMDAGASASDACAGSRTANIVTVNPVNTSVPGDYTVTYNVSDGNGNNAVEVTRTVTVEDTTPPTGTIVINNNESATNSRDVTLSLTWSDACSGTEKMRFSNDGASWTAWEPVAAAQAHALTGADGYNTVRVQYRDAAGNASTVFSDYIRLDTTPPTGTIVINNNRSATNSPSAALALTWSDGAGTGVVRMRFSDDGAIWSAWEPLAAAQAHTLAGPDGHNTVRVQYRDAMGNNSAVFSDYIRLDTVPPTGTIIINGGALNTATQSVILALAWSDGSGAGVTRMRFSDNGSTWTAWLVPAATRNHTLPAGLGYHTVRVQYADGGGNYSAVRSDYIKLVAP
jgi:subtilisin family serine protease